LQNNVFGVSSVWAKCSTSGTGKKESPSCYLHTLYDDTEAGHMALLYYMYCETRRLSRTQVLHRIFEMREAKAIFLKWQ